MTSTAENSRTRRVLLAAFAVIAAIGHFLRDVLCFLLKVQTLTLKKRRLILCAEAL